MYAHRELALLSTIRNLLRRRKPHEGFVFSRPLVLLQSDDWGRVGVRDREGYEQLRANGIRLGERPYDLYSLETADDVHALASMLERHRDSAGHSASLVMNFCTANLDFARMREEGFNRLLFLPLAKGLPGKWSRPGLKEAVREGIEKRVFFPALHGTIHCSRSAMERALAEGGDRARMLRLLWQAETPYIHWRMPWVGYEYQNPENPRAGFLSFAGQCRLVTEARANFIDFFGVEPVSACAPGYRANRETCRAWSEIGIRTVQNGTGDGLRPPHFDEFGLLHVYRSLDFEPSERDLETAKYLEVADACFALGFPLIISAHSINFHSTLRDFRSPTISALDHLLTALESKYPELVYVNDRGLHAIVTQGALESESKRLNVSVRRQPWTSGPMLAEAV